MPLPKPKLLAGWRRAKLIALINELYLSFRGCGTCGVVVNALALSTNPQAGPLRYSLAFHLRRSKKPNCEPKLRPPAVSKSLTRSIRALVDRRQSQQPHEALHPLAVDVMALDRQPCRHPARAIIGPRQIVPINQRHNRKILRADLGQLAVH